MRGDNMVKGSNTSNTN